MEKLKSLDLITLKQQYMLWLTSQNLSLNTISTSKTDAFYILKHNPNFDFWGMIESDNFEDIARSILIETLTKHSKGNMEGNINGYLAHLRRFRRFVYSDTGVDAIAKPIMETPKFRASKKKQSINIPTPTNSEVRHYLTLWEAMENYRLQEDALDKLFIKLAPFNTDLSDILIKTATLNDFYSTNIFSIYPVAKHILSLQIDKRLDNGDETLVEDIQTVVIGNKAKNFYSFATKYCSNHRPLDYPIYDSYVDEVLRYFRDKDGFAIFANQDLKNVSVKSTPVLTEKTPELVLGSFFCQDGGRFDAYC